MNNPLIKRFLLPHDGHEINVGDGVATSFSIEHPLNTMDVHVNIFRNSNNKRVNADVEKLDSNHVIVSFAQAPTANQFRVSIIRK